MFHCIIVHILFFYLLPGRSASLILLGNNRWWRYVEDPLLYRHVYPQTLQWCGIAMHLLRFFLQVRKHHQVPTWWNFTVSLCCLRVLIKKSFFDIYMTSYHRPFHKIYRANPADSFPRFPINTLYESWNYIAFSHLKVDVWNTILSFWYGLFVRGYVRV